jgi:hypothetical protein
MKKNDSFHSKKDLKVSSIAANLPSDHEIVQRQKSSSDILTWGNPYSSPLNQDKEHNELRKN